MRTPRLPIGALLLVAAGLPALATSARAVETADEPPGPTLVAATADRSAAGCPPLRFSLLQQRVLNVADRGDESLRRYVNRTRAVHQLDLLETALWVDQVRMRNADCRSTITAMAP